MHLVLLHVLENRLEIPLRSGMLFRYEPSGVSGRPEIPPLDVIHSAQPRGRIPGGDLS